MPAAQNPHRDAVGKADPTQKVFYTICPVFTASNIAAEKGWLREELEKAGADLRYLRSLSDGRGWLPHYSHRLDNLFRDGGNIPAIWAKADVENTKLVGLTAFPSTGQIVVRAKSDFYSVDDLKGRRIALPKSLNRDKVDWSRASVEWSLLQTLALHGLRATDVALVDIAHPDEAPQGQFEKPSELWALRRQDASQGPEAEALLAGRVDAIYSSHGRSSALVKSGEFKVIEDLSRHPDWTLSVANSPWSITVNAALAETHPGIVVAYLRAAIRAASWIKKNPEEAAETFTKVTLHACPHQVARLIAGLDFVPNLSPKNLAGVNIQKQFLLEQGYIRRDFDVAQWADTRYLEEARRGL